LEATPEAERHGRVFPIPLTVDKAGRKVSAIGTKAGVIVDEATRKPATAHDYRRAFGTRWSKRVMPAVLRRLMRHKDIDTTLKYYVDQDAEDIAADLWAAYRKGNNSGNTTQEKAAIPAIR
jgi:integrase